MLARALKHCCLPSRATNAGGVLAQPTWTQRKNKSLRDAYWAGPGREHTGAFTSREFSSFQPSQATQGTLAPFPHPQPPVGPKVPPEKTPWFDGSHLPLSASEVGGGGAGKRKSLVSCVGDFNNPTSQRASVSTPGIIAGLSHSETKLKHSQVPYPQTGLTTRQRKNKKLDKDKCSVPL